MKQSKFSQKFIDQTEKAQKFVAEQKALKESEPTSNNTTQDRELFTGGNWKFEKHETGRYYGNIYSELGKGENGIMNIRTIDIILKNCGEEEAEANALLISEAKNMYEALKGAVEMEDNKKSISDFMELGYITPDWLPKATEIITRIKIISD